MVKVGFSTHQPNRAAQSLTIFPSLHIACYFTCFDDSLNLRCLSQSDVCDGDPDCSDGSDEFACGESNFIFLWDHNLASYPGSSPHKREGAWKI